MAGFERLAGALLKNSRFSRTSLKISRQHLPTAEVVHQERDSGGIDHDEMIIGPRGHAICT